MLQPFHCNAVQVVYLFKVEYLQFVPSALILEECTEFCLYCVMQRSYC